MIIWYCGTHLPVLYSHLYRTPWLTRCGEKLKMREKTDGTNLHTGHLNIITNWQKKKKKGPFPHSSIMHNPTLIVTYPPVVYVASQVTSFFFFFFFLLLFSLVFSSLPLFSLPFFLKYYAKARVEVKRRRKVGKKKKWKKAITAPTTVPTYPTHPHPHLTHTTQRLKSSLVPFHGRCVDWRKGSWPSIDAGKKKTNARGKPGVGGWVVLK